MSERSILRAVASVVSTVLLVAAMASPAAGGPPEGFTVYKCINSDALLLPYVQLSVPAAAREALLAHGWTTNFKDCLGPPPG